MQLSSAPLRRALVVPLALLALWGVARAQTPAPKADYAAAAKYSLSNLLPRSYSTAVQPKWIGKTDRFWYSYRTAKGVNFWLVDPAKKTRAPLFDRDKLAGQIAELSKKPIDADILPITQTRTNEAGTVFTFVFGDTLFHYDLAGEKLVSKGKAQVGPSFPEGGFPKGKGKRGSDESADDFDDLADEPQEVEKKDGTVDDKTKGPPTGTKGGFGRGSSTSLDKKTVVFTKDNDLYIADAGKTKDAVRLSKDGNEDYSFVVSTGFGGFGGGGRRPGAAMPKVNGPWSKDSKFMWVSRSDSRNVKELYLVNPLTTPRPALMKYKYPMPGEEAIRKTELHVVNRDAKTVARVAPKWRDEQYSDIHWGKEPGELRFVRMDRLRRNLELCAVDVVSGAARTLISESIENGQLELEPVKYLEDSDEMIWWSERSGWGHYYLFDRQGKKKNAITTGSWRASRLLDVDEKARTAVVLGNGREKGENVYYSHAYAVKLDGSGLTPLTPGDANHSADLSPSKKFVVDNESRVDKAPVSTLRDDKGNVVMQLETADLSRLREFGWEPPTAFSVKAGDGVTELYGNIWKPFNFDANKKYPIIAHVYPGPQQEGVTHTFSFFNTNMQLAQLGFVVIQVGNRGGTPNRSKAYSSFGYYNLRDYGLEDKKTAIEQLAARYPWIDVKKVGIYGHSGGGFMSTAAMLQKPYNDFFKVAVSSAGNHDNNIYNNYWAERYHGLKEIVAAKDDKDKKTATPGETPAAPPPVKAAPPPVPATKFEIKVPTNTELAGNLKGKLLLVHGDMDNNVHPAGTMRLVDALIKANKRFDLLIIPGKAHGFGDATPYFNRRLWEYFAEHLLGDRRSGADIRESEGE